MLSIGAMSAGQGRYYASLAQDDYYLRGGEPQGRWWGKGAELLRLGDTVNAEQLTALFRGYAPDGRPLIQHRAIERGKHQPGWDLTFSAPKSVSVLWSQAGEQLRRAIQEEHDHAVQTTLDHIERTMAWTRRGKGGQRLERAGLIVSKFEHGSSRALDPQLHTHCLVMNIGVRFGSDGTTGTILSKPLYEAQRALGALYRAELARGLERGGIGVERVQDWFEVKGLPQELLEHFSKRRAAIEEQLSSRGLESASAAAFATLATREPKTLVPPWAELFRKWQEEGRNYNLTLTPPRGQTASPADIIAAAAAKLSQQHSHFSEIQLLQHMAEAAPGNGLGIVELRQALSEAQTLCPDLIPLGNHGGQARYTTREIWQLEQNAIATAQRLHEKNTHYVPHTLREKIIAEHPHLSGEQAETVRHLTRQNRGHLRIVEGAPGSGKTSALCAARKAWENAGYRVIGATVSGKAARELEKGSGIPSLTLAQLKARMADPSLGRTMLHHGQQIVRAARGKPTWKLRPLAIDAKTILVIDEAAMLGTRQMSRLLTAVERQGGMLVLVGDRKQLQSIEAGAPFGHLADQLGSAKLDTIRRQRDRRDIAAIRDIGRGTAQRALKDYAERGLLTVEEDRAKAISRLVDDWHRAEETQKDRALILVGTNREASRLNSLCQQRRRDSGHLSPTAVGLADGGAVYAGDRVLVTKRSKLLSVENGDLGTVSAMDVRRRILTVELDRGGRALLPLKDFAHVRLGYAVTTHKGQGSTFNRVFVLAGGQLQDRELSYVQLSRHRLELRLYTDRNEAGEDLTRLARAMGRSHQKTLAHELTRPQPEHTHSR